MRSSTAVALALGALLVATLVGAVAAAPSAAAPDDVRSPPGLPASLDDPLSASQDDPLPALQDDPTGQEMDRQVITVELDADGDARWTIASQYRIESDADADAFDELAEDLVAGSAGIGYDQGTFSRVVDEAQAGTDREMAIEDAGWGEPTIEPINDSPGAETDARIGTITYSVTWTNFAAVDGDAVVLGDVFWNGGETWFPDLKRSQRLDIDAPPNYAPENAPRGHENGTITWVGPHAFDENEIRATYVETAGGPGPTETPTATTESPGGGSGTFSSTLLYGIGLIALLAAVGAAGYLVAKHDSNRIPTTGADGTETNGGSAAASADGQPEDASAEQRAVATASGAPAERKAGDAAATTAVGSGDDEVDVELLSDEERVLRMLDRNDGRMKQARIVTETGWSNAKVSQLLSKMDDEGDIEKLRIGRENLITLPDVDPTGTH